MDRKAISCEMVKDLFGFFKDKLNVNKDVNFVCFQDPFEDYGIEYHKEDDGYYQVDYLALPCVAEICDDDYFLREVILEKYDIDIFKHIKGLSESMNLIIFSILHELGHYHQYLTISGEEFLRLSKEYVIGLKELDIIGYCVPRKIIEHYYRNLSQEAYADSIAVYIIKKYKDELYKMFERYDSENDQQEFGYGYYEIC